MKDNKCPIKWIEDMKARHSGWSGVKCSLCKMETTNAAYSYSMRFYGKPLCRVCQSLEKYAEITKKEL